MLAVSHAGEMRVVLDLYRVLRLRGQLGSVLVSISWGWRCRDIEIGCCW